MEMTLAVLMALGIFVGIPVVIGLAVAGAYVMKDRKNRAAAGFTTAYHTETAQEKVNAR